MMVDYLIKIIVVGLASTFVSWTMAYFNCPFFLLSWLRKTVGVFASKVSSFISIKQYTGFKKMVMHPIRSLVKSFAEIVMCPFCMTPWVALLLSFLVIKDLSVAQFVVFWFASSGISYLFMGVIDGHSSN